MAKLTKTKGVYLHSEARWSKAYMKLTRTARDILRLVMEKRQIFEGEVANNGHIEITFDWAMKKLEKSKKCVSDAFRQLIGVGFFVNNSLTGGALLKLIVFLVTISSSL